MEDGIAYPGRVTFWLISERAYHGKTIHHRYVTRHYGFTIVPYNVCMGDKLPRDTPRSIAPELALGRNGASSTRTITDKSGLSRSTLEFRERSTPIPCGSLHYSIKVGVRYDDISRIASLNRSISATRTCATIDGARMPNDACTRGHAYPREIACTRRGHPANSLVQACPIIGVGIRVSVHTYLSLLPRDARPHTSDAVAATVRYRQGTPTWKTTTA
ncbi:Uncharacterized protein DBV15_10934 [Temnothorax longispinosus]|uniref:Uncharacterized protein n=1 Tax=Temnothorax longispinosus TaxID=300112 RepID=A0A4S2KFS7_9HYME|nr:Uncharacterized protein DBV15_10934 [Temnothorax longispinosus]